MKTIPSIQQSPFPGGALVRFCPVGADHALFIFQRPGEAKAAGITRYQADTLNQYSGKVLANDGTALLFTGRYWPFLATATPPKGGSPKGFNLTFNTVNGPAALVQANGLPPGDYDGLLVALADVCPAAYQTLYQDDRPGGYSVRVNPMNNNCDTAHGSCLLGSNMGCFEAADLAGLDFCIVNGQGAASGNPAIVGATAFRFTVAAVPVLAPGGSQVYAEDFSVEATFGPRTNIDIQHGAFDQVMTTASGLWDVKARQVDLNNTNLFWHAGHIMPVVFEAGTEGSSEPAHSQYGALMVSPQHSWDISQGVFHGKVWIDVQGTNRRYPSIILYPATDEITGLSFQENVPVSASNQAIFIEMENGVDQTNVLAGGRVNISVTGAAGQAPHQAYFPLRDYQIAWPTDCRVPLEWFVDLTGRLVLAINGVAISDVTDPAIAAFVKANPRLRMGVVTWSYHTAIDTDVLPIETLYPHSWENHEGPVAGEVLAAWPASFAGAAPAWSTLSPAAQSPFPAITDGMTLLDLVKALSVPPAPVVTLPAGWSTLPASGPVTVDAIKALIAELQGLLAAGN